MVVNSGLTFDLDDMTIEDERVVKLLNWLLEEFGSEYVWFRTSSSGDGLHVMIAELVYSEVLGVPELVPILIPTETQMKYREMVEIECRGRRISDSYRKKVGMRTSRVFKMKNGKQSGEWIKWVQ